MFFDWLEAWIIKKLEETKVYCKNCDSWETVRVTKKFTTYKCECGVTVYYPPKKDRAFGVKRFISKEEYLFNKRVNEENLIEELENKGIEVKKLR